MAEAENESPPESSERKGGILSKWNGLAGWQKAGVLIGAGGLIIAILMYWQSRNQPTNGTAGGASGAYALPLYGSAAQPTNYPGANETFPSLPTSTSGGASTATTSGAILQGAINPPAFTNIASGEAGTGLLGSGVTVYSSGGHTYAMQPGGSYIDLSSVLPTGAKVYGGGGGRYWYELPGSNTQLLLTSGGGPAVNTGKGSPIGISVKPPPHAYTV